VKTRSGGGGEVGADTGGADKAGATGKEDIYQFLIIIKVGLMIKVEAILD